MTPLLLFGLGAAFLSALCQSATDIGTKAATREAEERLILATEWVVSAVVLSILCLIAYPALLIHPAAAFAELFRPRFWPILLAGSSLNVAAYYFYVRAFRLSDASLVAPIILVTPVFLLITSPMMVGEHASSIGVLGVVVSVFGSIFLAFSEPGKTRRLSLIAFLRDPGVYAMGITAVLWSITANLDKLGVQASAPLLWIALLSIVIAGATIVLWLVLPRQPLRLRSLRYALIAGATNAVGNAAQMYALTVLFVPYVIAIKRMSALFTVIAGGVMLRETIRRRVVAAAIMLIGAVLVLGAISKRPEANPPTRLGDFHRSANS